MLISTFVVILLSYSLFSMYCNALWSILEKRNINALFIIN